MRVITLLGLGCLTLAGTALAQTNTATNGTPTVITLGGGPRTVCGPAAGYANGNTLQSAQFNAPYACAADVSGNVYIADKNNNAVRLITHAGDMTTSTTSTYGSFPGVIGVATDPSNNVYILLSSGTIYQYLYRNPIETNSLGGGFGGSATAIAAVQDGSGQVFVAANDSGQGEIWLCNMANGTSTELFSAAGFQPAGLTITSNSQVAVSDLANNAIYLFNPGTRTLSLWVGGHGAGYADGGAGISQFNQPHGLTTSSDGHVIVADTGNNFVRQIDVNGNTTTIYGTTSDYWPPHTYCDATPAIYRGWLDGAAGGDSFDANSAEAFEPVSVAIGPSQVSVVGTNGVTTTNSALFVTELYYSLFREVTGLTVSAVTSNSVSTNSVPTTFAQNSVGFENDYYAGVGATAFIPVNLNLASGTTLQSVQFDIEVNPDPGNPDTSLAPLTPMSVSTNDFIQYPGAAPAGTTVTFTDYPYPTASNGQGLAVTAIGNKTGLAAQNNATLALIKVHIPTTVKEGWSYSLNVLYPSGTSNGIAGIVPLTSLATRHLHIAHVPYMAGDSAPAHGYNAGEFGDTNLDNADVNNAFYAFGGIRVPFAESDAFNAMDVYPESLGVPGDGSIGFNDVQTILFRSLGQETNNWERWWAADGSGLTNSPINWSPSLGAGKVKLGAPATPPGNVWFCQAYINAQSVETPFGEARIPVSVNVRNGCSLGGLAFRAVVSANNGAPAPGAVQFSPAGAATNMTTLPGLSPNDILCGWFLGSFPQALQGSNFLGYLTFPIPNATAGQSYSVHFLSVGGAPDLNTEYQLESFPGVASVAQVPAAPASRTSDEWKIHFFGSTTNALAADNVDADGDGMSNLQEYLAGTDPTDALSSLHFSTSALITNGTPAVSYSWLTAPGKSYVLEARSAIQGGAWTAVSTNLGDGYPYQAIINNHSGSAEFYRIRLQQ